MKRISWEHLRKHPFWTKEVNGRKLPRQPTFDDYLRKFRNVDPDAFAEQQAAEGYFIPNLAHFIQPGRADAVRLSQRVKKNMMKKTGDYAINAEGNTETDIQLKNHDQELVFESGNDRDELAEETKNIDDMSIDVTNPGGQNDDTVMRTANTTVLTVEQEEEEKALVFRPQNPAMQGRMSLKGALPTAPERALRDEPFLAGGEEEKKGPRTGPA